MHRSYYVEGTEQYLYDLDPKVKVIGQKAGICDCVPSTSALVLLCNHDVCNMTHSAYFVKSTPPRAFSVSLLNFAGMLQTY